MGFHLAPQTATGRTSPLDQRCAHPRSRLVRRQLRHGPHRLQQLAHGGRRERRQHLDFPWASQVGSPRLGLRPRPCGLGHAPHRPARSGPMRLPGPRRLRVACVPAPRGLRLRHGARGAGALAAPRHPGGCWGGRRGMAQRRRTVPRGVAAAHQPCGARPRAFDDRPDVPAGPVRGPPPACRLPPVPRVPRGVGPARAEASRLRGLRAASLPPRAGSAPRAPLLGHAPRRCTPRARRGGWPRRGLPPAVRGHSGPPGAVPPGEGVAGEPCARPSLPCGSLHPRPAHRALGLTRARLWPPPRLAPLGHVWPQPLWGPDACALHQRPQAHRCLRRGPAGVHAPPLSLAPPAVRLARGSPVGRAGRLLRPRGHTPRAAVGHGGRRRALRRPLWASAWARPRGLGPAVVHGGAVGAGHVARQVGQVPCALPGPLPSQRVRSAPARGARAGLATVAKPPPAGVEACAQGAHRCRREAPAPRGVPRPLPAVNGLGCDAIRGLLPAMPAAPRQWPAAAAALQGQLVTRYHGRFLRTVSEHAQSSQRLLGASAQAILLSRD